MQRQTILPDQWLIINDGEPYQYANLPYQDIHHRQHGRGNSLIENWLHALPRIEGDKILVMEDDDWYHPEYVETLGALLADFDLAGVKQDLYYKLRIRKFQRWHNMTHASLAASGFRRSVLPEIERCCTVFAHSVFIDMFLWAEITADPTYTSHLIPNWLADKRALRVAMKMMPGAAGLGNGHTHDGSTDHSLRQLEEWIGIADCRIYRQVKYEQA